MDSGFPLPHHRPPRSPGSLPVTESAARNESAKNEPLLLRQDREGIATLILNRPQARNALSMALMGDLLSALAALAGDPAVKVVILAAAGPGFCAGHDLKELRR